METQENPSDSAKGRSLRRTVSVPSEGQFPEFQAEGATMHGKNQEQEDDDFLTVKSFYFLELLHNHMFTSAPTDPVSSYLVNRCFTQEPV